MAGLRVYDDLVAIESVKKTGTYGIEPEGERRWIAFDEASGGYPYLTDHPKMMPRAFIDSLREVFCNEFAGWKVYKIAVVADEE